MAPPLASAAVAGSTVPSGVAPNGPARAWRAIGPVEPVPKSFTLAPVATLTGRPAFAVSGAGVAGFVMSAWTGIVSVPPLLDVMVTVRGAAGTVRVAWPVAPKAVG